MADILFGVVKDNVDPEGLGRVTVALADHGEEVVLPWIRVVQPIASADAGMIWLPEIDDNVVVLAGGRGLESMLVLGSVYSGNRKPPGEAKVEHKHILTAGGNEILIDDTEGSELIKINTKDGAIEILLDNATPEITITAGENLTINANSAVTVNASDVDVAASGSVTIKGDSSVKVEGGSVEVKSSGTVKVSGSMVELG
ncbi:MAG: hypothetical protein KC656_01260 [Myxococcales bacterium]|nr:hypothetical protein [Myxococcales bacterium]MCB9670667.1 hypothetical protein [Alphaproteobacteria bacterium]MCB9693771.1 hypothetical protein [Alphaproteobacteria bacterium]